MKPSRLTATKAGLPVTKKKKPIGRVQHAQSNRKDSSSCSGLLLFIIGIFIFATINILQNDSIINIKARISQIHSLPSLPSLPSLYSRQSLRTNVEEVPPSVTNKEDVEVSEIPLKTREVKLETLVDTFRSKSLETEPTSKGSTTSSLTSSLITSKVDKNKNKKKKASRYPKEPDQPYIDYGYERHIKKIIGEKTGVRQDLRVVLPDLDYAPFTRPPGDPSNILGAPRAYVAVRERLEHLPLLSYLKDNKQGEPSLESTMMYLHTLPMCADKPVFLTMATVGDDLYWQLIENYVYTMVKFDTVECSIVVCVSDPKCVRLCDENFFPCFNFKSEVNPLPSVMEQIGELKLFHVPRALESGVDVFMLDLDVGFLYSPMVLVKAFYATPHVDIFVQEDIIWVMNRSAAAWKTWTSQMLPNIGMFLCRGNNKTARVFSIAWGHYNNMDDVDSKKNPGKDQNHVLEGMRYGRVKFGLRYAYFGNTTAVLLDKMNLYGNRSVELGGMAAYNLLAEGNTMAAHMTCYEHTTKVLGMKATNSFWNPLYYDPLRPTITKQIIYVNDAQVLEEVRALLWLGMTTQRAVIIPNLLGSHVPESGGYYEGRKYWPGFRVAKIKRDEGISVLKVDLLEPAFYWRVQRDYDEPPVPEVLFYDPEIDSLDKIRLTLLSKYASHPRVVLHPLSGYSKNSKRAFSIDAGDQHIVRDLTAQVIKWASDSVGYSEGDYDSTMKSYLQIPSLRNVDRNTAKVSDVLDGVRNCNDIFGRLKGNRTCFQICD